MQKANALADIFDLAVEARADHALWESEHKGGADPWWRSMKSVWREVETRQIGSEEARMDAFCVPLRSRPGLYIIIELKLIGEGIELRFRPVPHRRHRKRLRASNLGKPLARRTRKRSPRLRAMYRKHRRELRAMHRYFEVPFTVVPLVPDDAELRALVAMRCMQQDYHADAARNELRGYARKMEIPDVRDVIDDVLNRVVQYFVSSEPGDLGSHIKSLKRVVLAEEAEAHARRAAEDAVAHGRAAEEAAVRGSTAPKARESFPKPHESLLTVWEAARKLGVSRRTLYHWIQHGIIVLADKYPYLIAPGEVQRVRDAKLVYRVVRYLRQCSYDAARVWVGRRRTKGLTDREIIEEAKDHQVP